MRKREVEALQKKLEKDEDLKKVKVKDLNGQLLDLRQNYQYFDKASTEAFITVFNLDTCDNCKETVLGANSIKVAFGVNNQSTRKALEKAGLKAKLMETNDIYFIDKEGNSYCLLCHKEK